MSDLANTKLHVSISPHVQSTATVPSVMWTVNLALLPALVVSVLAFGVPSLIVIAVGTLSAVITEWAIVHFLFKRKSSIADGSAVLTGLLLSFNLPSGIPLWMVAVGSVFAIGLGKMIFGGLGHNPFNPALVGRAFMLASFPAETSVWPQIRGPMVSGGAAAIADGTSTATPLAFLAENGTAELPGYLDLFLGRISGSMGEISTLAILLGGLFMLQRKIINWETPVCFLGGLALFTGVFWIIDPSRYADPLFHLLAGSAMLGAWFMATDMVTSPMTFTGRVIYAASAGLITGLIRLFGAYPEGVSYAILIMNALVPVIDKYVMPPRFGAKPVTAAVSKGKEADARPAAGAKS